MIVKASIAGINTKIDSESKRFLRNLQAFRSDFRGEPAVSLKVTDLELKNFCSKYKGYDRERATLRLFAEKFFAALPELGGFGIKAAVVLIGGKAYVVAGGNDGEGGGYIGGLEEKFDDVSAVDDSYAAVMSEDGALYVYTTPFTKTPVSEKHLLSGIIFPGNVKSVTSASRKDIFDRFSVLLPLPKRGEQLASVFAGFDGIENRVPCISVPENDPEALYTYLKNLQGE